MESEDTMESSALNGENKSKTMQKENCKENNVGKDDTDEEPDGEGQYHDGKREWKSKFDYFFILIGMTVGFGNTWMFPYYSFRNGGGPFLVAYLIMTCTVALPLCFLETIIGQFTSRPWMFVFELCPAFKGMAYCIHMVGIVIDSVYSLNVCYSLIYLYLSFNTNLPWSSCSQNGANSFECEIPDTNSTGENWTEISSLNNSRRNIILDTDAYFHNEVLEISSGFTDLIGIVPQIAVCAIIIWTIVTFSVYRGINFSAKIARITCLLAVFIIILLLVRTLSLPGSETGLLMFLNPDFQKLKNFQVWRDAFMQVFFSSTVAAGLLTTYSSRNPYGKNSMKISMSIPFVNAGVSFLSGLSTFSLLGYLAHINNAPIKDIITSGPGLALITIPKGISLIPLAPVWAVMFFLMNTCMGLDTLITATEGHILSLTYGIKSLKGKERKFGVLLCILSFLGSLFCTTRAGMYVIYLVDRFCVTAAVAVVAFLEIVMLSFIYGSGNIARDIETMIGKKINVLFWISWTFFLPITLLIMVVVVGIDAITATCQYRDYECESWVHTGALIFCGLLMISIPAFWLYYMIFQAEGSTFKERLIMAHSPTPKWGPKMEQHRVDWDLGRSEENSFLKKVVFRHVNTEDTFQINLDEFER